jgi:hypothetical protein
MKNFARIVGMVVMLAVALAAAGCGPHKVLVEEKKKLCSPVCCDWCELDQCVAPYGCLSKFHRPDQCAWIETDPEKVGEEAIYLLAVSGRMTSPDQIVNSEVAGVKAMGALRVVEYLVGRSLFRKVFGSLASQGHNDTGYGEFQKMGGLVKGIVAGTADHFTLGESCNFEVCGEGIHLFQGYARIVLPRQQVKVFAANAADAVKASINQVPEAAKPALEEMASKLYEAAEKDAVESWDNK